jgi:hypothetical protein
MTPAHAAETENLNGAGAKKATVCAEAKQKESGELENMETEEV